jgi:ring-1,2-phenylacetyl-CoA epoxidase subunit PaaE
LYYYWFYMRSLGRRPVADQLRVVGENVLFLGMAAALVWQGYAREMLLYWFLPARISATLLAWLFNYLPHRPYRARAADDPLRATGVYCVESRLVRLISAGHNLHQVHHLFPGIPFFDYLRVWRELGPELRTRNTAAIDTRSPA